MLTPTGNEIPSLMSLFSNAKIMIKNIFIILWRSAISSLTTDADFFFLINLIEATAGKRKKFQYVLLFMVNPEIFRFCNRFFLVYLLL